MLILRLRPGEAIVITDPDGDEIRIVVEHVTLGRSVKLAITAPRKFTISRPDAVPVAADSREGERP